MPCHQGPSLWLRCACPWQIGCEGTLMALQQIQIIIIYSMKQNITSKNSFEINELYHSTQSKLIDNYIPPSPKPSQPLLMYISIHDNNDSFHQPRPTHHNKKNKYRYNTLKKKRAGAKPSKSNKENINKLRVEGVNYLMKENASGIDKNITTIHSQYHEEKNRSFYKGSFSKNIKKQHKKQQSSIRLVVESVEVKYRRGLQTYKTCSNILAEPINKMIKYRPTTPCFSGHRRVQKGVRTASNSIRKKISEIQERHFFLTCTK